MLLQWPLVFALVTTGIGLIYYFGPDADQDWVWITPGAVAATVLWLLISLLFKLYVANFTDYEGSYGTVGGVIVVLLWFYVSGIAILTGAELNAEIEHASPYGKAPGQKNAERKALDRCACGASVSAAAARVPIILTERPWSATQPHAIGVVGHRRGPIREVPRMPTSFASTSSALYMSLSFLMTEPVESKSK